LGGDGSTGCDWVIWAYETTREYCLTRITCLMSSLNRVDQT
jgi:hypothetical protein